MIDADRIAAAPRQRAVATGWRHSAPQYDPSSGEGARKVGGRFNPPDSFPVLYLCTTRPCALAELQRLGHRQPIGVAGLLPRQLYRYELELSEMLDLTDRDVRDALALDPDTLVGPDWNATQHIGDIAHRNGFHAIRSPSATGVDDVLAVFSDIALSEIINVVAIERWETLEDLIE